MLAAAGLQGARAAQSMTLPLDTSVMLLDDGVLSILN